MPTRLADYVLSRLAAEGVRHVFFVPGGGAMHLNDALALRSDVQAVGNLHEQASAIAAEAYARASSGLGAAMVTSGPGSTNALTGVVAAWLDSTPCVFLSGQAKRADLKGETGVRQMGSQEVDIVPVVSTVTKYAATVLDPASVRAHLDTAFRLARSGRPGPVWIDVPLDVQAATVDPESLRPEEPPPPTPAGPDLVEAVAELYALLARAERPVLLAGNGIHVARAESLFDAFVEHLGIPVLTTGLGADLIDDGDPLFAGRPGPLAPRGANFTLQNADFLLVLGCRLDANFVGYSHENLARGARKVMVDVDPAEIAKMRTRIDVPIVADAGTFLRAALAARAPVPATGRPAWLERIQAWRRRYPFVRPEHRVRPDGRISTYAFAENLSDAADAHDVILPGSSGVACELSLVAFRTKKGQRNFHNRGTGAMGFGLPAALGACLGSGGRRTLCVDGDGGFFFNVQELATLSRLRLPVKVFVVNNGGYASIRASQIGYFGRLLGADASSGLVLPDVTRVAESFGVPAIRLGDPAGLRDGVRRVLDSDGPFLCEVIVAPDEPREPRLATTRRPDGSMVSKPLEDLFPFLPRDEFLENMIVPTLPE